MSRTFDVSSVKGVVQARWRQFAASATGFAHKYRDDSLLRTEISVIALEIGYALLVIAVSVGAIFLLYHEMARSVTSTIVSIFASPDTTLSPEAVVRELKALRTKEAVGLAALVLAGAVIFGYLITRFALAPARNALASQKRFIGNIAHELRTPLSVIRMNTEVRLLSSDVSSEARAVHESNLEELGRISNLINNLLTLNALLNPDEIPFRDVDLANVVQGVFKRLAPLARERKVRMRLTTTQESPVWGNDAALEQVVTNLVKNAVQHTRDGEVRVAIGPVPRGVELVIVDTGTGIGSEDLVRIFEPFYRGDQARTRAGGAGSGLGLTIVNELIKLHGGSVRIQSTLGAGTRVVVLLSSGHPSKKRRRKRLDLPPVQPVIEAAADFSRH